MTLLDPSKLFLANLAITIVLKVFPWQLPQRERERERKGSRRGFLGNCLQERENNLRDKEVLERERDYGLKRKRVVQERDGEIVVLKQKREQERVILKASS